MLISTKKLVQDSTFFEILLFFILKKKIYHTTFTKNTNFITMILHLQCIRIIIMYASTTTPLIQLIIRNYYFFKNVVRYLLPMSTCGLFRVSVTHFRSSNELALIWGSWHPIFNFFSAAPAIVFHAKITLMDYLSQKG